MKISTLFRRLSFGELSNLAISVDGSGTIVENKHAQLIQYTNEGLLRLHSRFLLRENHLIIEQVAHITNYHLKRIYAESQADPEEVPYAYIKDREDEPFDEDVLKILEVHDSFGRKRVLNDPGRPDSLFTPQPDILQVPTPVDGQALGVSYQARHPILRDVPLSEEDDLLDQDIDIPFYLEGALQAFIGYKVYGHMNTPENITKGQEYLVAMERICNEIEQKDLVNQTYSNTHDKFSLRGFM